MNYLEAYKKDVKSFASMSSIEIVVLKEFEANENEIVITVRERWDKGESVQGGIIGTYRSPFYREFKQLLNPSARGTVDLFLTGALSAGLTLRKEGDLFQIYSTDKKYNLIGDKYGYDEYGLTRDEVKKLYERIYIESFKIILKELWQ